MKYKIGIINSSKFGNKCKTGGHGDYAYFLVDKCYSINMKNGEYGVGTDNHIIIGEGQNEDDFINKCVKDFPQYFDKGFIGF